MKTNLTQAIFDSVEHRRGCGREGERELARFLSIAAGSASELQHQLLVARDLSYLSAQAHHTLDDHVTEVTRMLYRFGKTLSGRRKAGNPALPASNCGTSQILFGSGFASVGLQSLAGSSA